jgi:protein tyrosine phosphatase
VPLYDEDRVQMPSKEFIHASLIITPEGIGGNYIQAQIPLVKPKRPRIDTQKIFWQMVWKLDVEICVCAAHLGKEKHCDFFFKTKVGARYKVRFFGLLKTPKYKFII